MEYLFYTGVDIWECIMKYVLIFVDVTACSVPCSYVSPWTYNL